MRKRIIALLLTLAMVFSLASCGKGGAGDRSGDSSGASSAPAVQKTYTSDQAMDVFETIEAVKKLKDFTFELQVNGVDAGTGEAAANQMVLSGECYASTKQAIITATMAGGDVFTHAVVDGDVCYIDIVSATQYLAKGFGETDEVDSEFFQEELAGLAEQFPTSYITVYLKEDPWATLEGSSFAEVKELIQEVYTSIKKDTGDKVSTDKTTCTLSLGLGDLQKELLKVSDSLVKEKKTYQAFLSSYIDDNFSDLLNASGWTMVDLMDTMWHDYEEKNEEMSQLEASGDWNDWSMKLVTCGDEASGYTLDLTDCRDTAVNYCLQVYPAQAKEIELPEESTNYAEIAEDVFAVYMDTLIYRNYTSEEVTDDYTDEYTEGEDGFDEGDTQVLDQLETTSIDGYSRLLSTEMVTDDGVKITVPVIKKYDSVEVEENGTGTVDIYQAGTGYQIELMSIEPDGRTLKEIAEDNVTIFESTMRDDYEYEITQKASEVNLSQDGSACVAGMAYYDSDEACNTTVLTGNIQVEGSEYVIGFDLIVYDDWITKKEKNSVNDFLTYLGLEAPVAIGGK